jgi:hypothetical protein
MEDGFGVSKECPHDIARAARPLPCAAPAGNRFAPEAHA